MATFTIRGTLTGDTSEGRTEVPVECSFTRADTDDGLVGLVAALVDIEGAFFESDPLLMADSVLIVTRGQHERIIDLVSAPSVAAYVTAQWPQ